LIVEDGRCAVNKRVEKWKSESHADDTNQAGPDRFAQTSRDILQQRGESAPDEVRLTGLLFRGEGIGLFLTRISGLRFFSLTFGTVSTTQVVPSLRRNVTSQSPWRGHVFSPLQWIRTTRLVWFAEPFGRQIVEKRKGMYRGFIAAAGLSTRLQDLSDNRNKVLLDLGGETILDTILRNYASVGIDQSLVVVGFDGHAVRQSCASKAECLYNPFFADYGILSSIWLARPHLDGQPFVFTTGDHYFTQARLETFLTEQGDADLLVDVEVKTCDDEDMKVYLNRHGKLRTMTKTMLEGPVLGEFTGLLRASAEGSVQLFSTLEKYFWQDCLQVYMADVLCATHRKWELAFHLSTDHHRIEIDFPCDLHRARQLYSLEQHRYRKAS